MNINYRKRNFTHRVYLDPPKHLVPIVVQEEHNGKIFECVEYVEKGVSHPIPGRLTDEVFKVSNDPSKLDRVHSVLIHPSIEQVSQSYDVTKEALDKEVTKRQIYRAEKKVEEQERLRAESLEQARAEVELSKSE